jgi:hypothetical protein
MASISFCWAKPSDEIIRNIAKKVVFIPEMG